MINRERIDQRLKARVDNRNEPVAQSELDVAAESLAGKLVDGSFQELLEVTGAVVYTFGLQDQASAHIAARKAKARELGEKIDNEFDVPTYYKPKN